MIDGPTIAQIHLQVLAKLWYISHLNLRIDLVAGVYVLFLGMGLAMGTVMKSTASLPNTPLLRTL